MLDDFRLRVFMMVAAEGSFTRAAQHLGALAGLLFVFLDANIVNTY